MSFPRFKIEQSKQEFYTSTSGLALVGVALNRFTTLASRVDKVAPHGKMLKDTKKNRSRPGAAAVRQVRDQRPGDELCRLAYNLLRAIGQVGLMDKKQARRAKQRRRLKTVLQDLMYFAARFLRHAHGLALRFSCHAHWQAQAFTKTYQRFAYG